MNRIIVPIALKMRNPVSAWSRAARAALAIVGLLLAGCSDLDTGEPTDPSSSTGTLRVTVKDPDGRLLQGAQVVVIRLPQQGPTYYYNEEDMAWSDARGVVVLGKLPPSVDAHVYWPAMSSRQVRLTVSQSGITDFTAVLQPAPPGTAYALFPVLVPAQGVSADRSELELHVRIMRWRGPDARAAPVGLSLRLSDGEGQPSGGSCYVKVVEPPAIPECTTPIYYPPRAFTGGPFSILSYSFDPQGMPDMDAQQRPFAALLLLDQGARIKQLGGVMDSWPSAPYATVRSAAARQFLRRVRGGATPDQIAVAGFAGPGGDPALPLQLPATPLWAPHGGPVFTADKPVLDSAIDTLEPLLGGSAPVFDALQAAMMFTTTHAPLPRRAIVASLGGDDDRGFSGMQRQQALAALRQQQANTGIQLVLLDEYRENWDLRPEDNRKRAALAELAAVLRAPMIWSRHGEGMLHGPLALASGLLTGAALPELRAVFRLKADGSGLFPSGTMLYGQLNVSEREVRCSSLGCDDGDWVTLPFVAEVP